LRPFSLFSSTSLEKAISMLPPNHGKAGAAISANFFLYLS
jgi:hypothetical protein